MTWLLGLVSKRITSSKFYQTWNIAFLENWFRLTTSSVTFLWVKSLIFLIGVREINRELSRALSIVHPSNSKMIIIIIIIFGCWLLDSSFRNHIGDPLPCLILKSYVTRIQYFEQFIWCGFGDLYLLFHLQISRVVVLVLTTYLRKIPESVEIYHVVLKFILKSNCT